MDGDATVFDSNAILLYLAEKTGKFLPANTPAARGRAAVLADVRRDRASGPFSGQAVHFKHFAPEKIAYALNRYEFEALRHWSILDARLAKHRYMLGDSYTDRRHGGLGLGPAGAVHPRRATPGRSCPTSSAWSTRSLPARRRRRADALKDGTPSRPRWTRRPSAPCSRATTGRKPSEKSGSEPDFENKSGSDPDLGRRLEGHAAERSAAVVLQERARGFLEVRRAAFAEVAALGGDRRDQVIAVHSLSVEAVARL